MSIEYGMVTYMMKKLYDYDGGGYPKKRNTGRRINYWETSWRKMLKDPELDNPWSNQLKKFRRRFRVKYKLFLLIVKLFKDVNLFNTTRNSAVELRF